MGNNRSIQRFLSELERRKVYRVAVGYLAVGWMLLEASAFIFPRVGMSEGAVEVLLTLLGLGFPVALVLSWTFDLTPEGLVKAEANQGSGKLSSLQMSEVGVIFVLLIALSWLIVERQSARKPSGAADNSIAVLPFVNMSNDSENEYFSDGITEELLNALANIKELRVAARTSSFFFKNKDLNILDIGRILGVGMMLEGSVRKAGNRVRITAQLIESGQGFHLWSDIYDSELKDIFAVQSEITRQVVAAITPMLLSDGQPTLTEPLEVNADSLDHYLRGRQYLRDRKDSSGLQQARSEFESALAIDATFHLPYAGLCDVSLLDYEHYREPDVFKEAEATCNRALVRQRDGSRSWEIHAALGDLYRSAGEYQKAIEQLDFAISSHGASPRLLRSKGMTLADMGNTAQAETALLRALEADERDWDTLTVLGNFYQDESRYPEAAKQYEIVLAMVPDYASALIGLGSAQYMAGDEEAAEATWLRAENMTNTRERGSLGNVYCNLGIKYYYSGDYAKAVELQEKATELRPADHRPWGRLAESWRGAGSTEAEREAYKHAIQLAMAELRINPADAETLGLLGIYHAFSGNAVQAHRYRDQLMASDPDNTTWLYFASLISLALDEKEAAFTYLEVARKNGLDSRFVAEDPDLQRLRALDSRRFQALTAGAN